MKTHYLYKISNTINSKLYIGITDSPSRRKRQHFKYRSGKAISIIKLAIDKHGAENFKFEILCCGSKEYIQDLEKKAIISYNSIDNGYNIRSGGEGGSGHSIKTRSDDTPIYVSGFWFPNPRTCLKCIDISKGHLYELVKDGTAGDLTRKSRTNILIENPVYVGGFWFNTLQQASNSLGKSANTLRKRLTDGFIEQKGIPRPSKELHHLHGRTGDLCSNSKAISVDGVVYSSLREASYKSIYSYSTISRGLKNKDPRYYYLTNEV